MKLTTLIPISIFLPCALSENLTIHIVRSQAEVEVNSFNCIIIDNEINPFCKNARVYYDSKTIDTHDPYYFGLGIQQYCSFANNKVCRLHFAWADIAADSKIHDVYFRDDGCFWNKEKNGAILLDTYGDPMCYKDLKKKWECQYRLFSNYITRDRRLPEPADNIRTCTDNFDDKEWKPTSSSLDEDEIVEEATEFQ